MFNRSSQYYDLIYEAVGKDYAAETQRLRELIQSYGIPNGSSLLDVGCGTAGHLSHLKDHYVVEGLDLDQGMLAQARSKLPDVPFHEADMAEFNLGRAYDVVVSLFSSIGYAKIEAGFRQTISRMAEHTRDGGLVIVEPWLDPEAYHAGVPHAVLVDRPELKIARLDVSQVEDGVSILDFHFVVASSDGVEAFSERHELGLFSQDQYVAAYKDADLRSSYDSQGLTGRGLYLGVKSGE